MSTDPVALSEILTEPPKQADHDDLVYDLVEIAAAIQRIEAELGAGANPAPDGLAAVDRVADIAFVLHERSVEATLCDDLDAAIREIAEACAHFESAAERTRKTAALLRALARRVGEMIARRTAESAGMPGDDATMKVAPSEGQATAALLPVIDLAAVTPPRAIPDPAAPDALAAVLALSEEELIALFS